MSTYTRLAILPVCAVSFALLACEDSTVDDTNNTAAPITRDDPSAPAADAPGAPANPTVGQEVNDFQDRMAGELETLNDDLELIRSRTAELGDEVRARYESALSELRDRVDTLEERINQIDVSDRARWVEMRSEIESTWVQLTDTIVEIRRELDSVPR